MRSLLKSRMATVCAGAVLAGTLVAVPAANADQRAADTAAVAEASSEDVLRAVFFGRGPLADEIDATVELPEDEITMAQYDAQVDIFLDELQERDSETVDKVAAGLTSGSPIEVERALELGTDFMVEVSGADDLPEDEPSPNQCGIGAFCVAVATLGALSWAVAQSSVIATSAAGITQAVVAWNGMYGPSAAAEQPELARERAIAHLAENLAR